MRSAVLTIPPATGAALDGRVHSRRCGIPSHRFSSVAFGLARRIARLTPIDGVSGHDHRRPALWPNFSSSGPQSWMRDQPPAFDSRNEKFKVQATSIPESAGESSLVPVDAVSARGNLMKTLYVGVLVALWYLFNIYFNIYNKQVLIFSSSGLTSIFCRYPSGSHFISSGFECEAFWRYFRELCLFTCFKSFLLNCINLNRIVKDMSPIHFSQISFELYHLIRSLGPLPNQPLTHSAQFRLTFYEWFGTFNS